MQNMHNSFITRYFKHNKLQCACRWLALLKLERKCPHTARFQLTAVPIVNHQLSYLIFKILRTSGFSKGNQNEIHKHPKLWLDVGTNPKQWICGPLLY